MECVGAEKWLEVLRLLNQVGFVPDSGREAKETQKKGKPDSQEDNSDDDGDDTDNDNDSCNSVDTIANISNLQIVCVGPNVPEELADQIFTMSSSAFLTPTALSPSDSAVDKTDKNNSDDAKDNDDDDSNNDSVSMSRSDIEYGYSVQVSFIRAVYDDFYKREKKRYKNRKKKAMKRKAKELKENNNDNIGTSSSTENAFITGASSSDSVSSPTSLSIPSSLVPPSAEILSPIPHMIVAFNSGICDFRDSWRETATLIADDKVSADQL